MVYVHVSAAYDTTTRWGIITGPPIAKWLNYVTVPFFGIKIPTTKHEIMLHAMSLKGGSRTWTNCALVFWQLGTNWISALLIRQWRTRLRACVKAKGGHSTLNTNWASSLECCCLLQQHILPDISAKFYQFCLFVQRLYHRNQRDPVYNYASSCIDIIMRIIEYSLLFWFSARHSHCTVPLCSTL